MKQSVYRAVSSSGDVPTNILISGASLVSLRMECCLRIMPFCNGKYDYWYVFADVCVITAIHLRHNLSGMNIFIRVVSFTNNNNLQFH